MKPDPRHEELRELLGAYALNALDPEEREQVDGLLLTDASARAELHELEHAAAWLGHASLRPPARAWDAIAAEVASDLNDDGLAPTVAPLPAPSPTATRPHRGARWLAAAALGLVALGAAAGMVALVDRTTEPTESVADQARAALNDTSARRATLRSDDGRWSARAVVLPDRTGYVRGEAMPPLPSGRALQLWSITPKGPVSAGVLREEAGWHRFRLADRAVALAVTAEPRGGSVVPSGSPIVAGELS